MNGFVISWMVMSLFRAIFVQSSRRCNYQVFTKDKGLGHRKACHASPLMMVLMTMRMLPSGMVNKLMGDDGWYGIDALVLLVCGR